MSPFPGSAAVRVSASTSTLWTARRMRIQAGRTLHPARFGLGLQVQRFASAHVVRTSGFVYPMVNRGGAREDWNDESSVAGESRNLFGNPRARFVLSKSLNLAAGHKPQWAVVTARQHSCPQQLVPRITRREESGSLDSWQWWMSPLRRQQAWGGAGIAACTRGTIFPSTPNNRSSLAVRRCTQNPTHWLAP